MFSNGLVYGTRHFRSQTVNTRCGFKLGGEKLKEEWHWCVRSSSAIRFPSLSHQDDPGGPPAISKASRQDGDAVLVLWHWTEELCQVSKCRHGCL